MSKGASGYTLIETLVALAVFAILATLTSSSMYYAFNTRARVTEQAERLNTLELAIKLIQADTEQIVLRSVRGDDMILYPAFVGESQYLEFTRAGFANPNSDEKRSNLKRVALFCRKNTLLQRTWASLDTTNRKAFQDKVLVDKLSACRFAYLDHSLQVLPEWRPYALQQNQRQEPLPKAIQMNLTLSSGGTISYLFVIPGAIYAEI